MPLLDDVARQAPSSDVWQKIEKAIGTNFCWCIAVLLLVVGINYVPQSFAPQPTFTAALSVETAPEAMLASFEQNTGALTLVTNMQAAEYHDHELRVKAGDGAKPASMGLVAPKGTASISVSDEIRQLLAQGAVLAISVEPKGGSTTGQLTGPVIATDVLNLA